MGCFSMEAAIKACKGSDIKAWIKTFAGAESLEKFYAEKKDENRRESWHKVKMDIIEKLAAHEASFSVFLRDNRLTAKDKEIVLSIVKILSENPKLVLNWKAFYDSLSY